MSASETARSVAAARYQSTRVNPSPATAASMAASAVVTISREWIGTVISDLFAEIRCELARRTPYFEVVPGHDMTDADAFPVKTT